MSVLVQNGTLHVGDGILAGKSWGRVRAMTNETGRKMKSAEPSAPVEILGMDSVPEAGEHFYVMDAKAVQETLRNFTLPGLKRKSREVYRR